MANTFIFNGKKIVLPGAYSTIVSGEDSPARVADYGTVLIIDTGNWSNCAIDNTSNPTKISFGGGSGIATSTPDAGGQSAIYSFNTIESYRQFMKGSLLYKLGDALFYPDPTNSTASGASQVLYVKAATTSASTMKFTTTDGGYLYISPKDEGVASNGEVYSSVNSAGATVYQLLSGYGFQVSKGVNGGAIFSFYAGTFTGYASDGIPFNEINPDNAVPMLYVQSPEITTIDEFVSWASTSSLFNSYFRLTGSNSGSIVYATDIVGKYDSWNGSKASGETGNFLSVGGTTDFTTAIDGVTPFQYVLNNLTDVQFNSVFTDIQASDDSLDTRISSLINYNNNAKFRHFIWVAGNTESSISLDMSLAKKIDDCYTQVVSGEAGVASNVAGVGYRWFGVAYTLASIVGRMAGKAPQIPITNKTLGIARLKTLLTKAEQESAINAGVVATIYDSNIGKFKVLLDCNTLQDNQNLFNNQGQSWSIQFMRIVTQINTELVINSVFDLLGDENGVNRNTLRAGTVQNWTIAYLQSRVATPEEDNLILSFQDVATTVKGTSYWTSYKLRVNNEINQLFFTGYLIS